MIKSVKELKEFIEWAKSHKVRSIKIDNIQFEFSDLAHIELNATTAKEMSRFDSKTMVDTEVPDMNEEEDLLYYSSPLKPLK